MPRKSKRKPTKAFIKIFIGLCITLAIVYYVVNSFFIQPHIFYPGFNIEIPGGYDIHGIDVSRYQQTINWQEVKNMEVNGLRIGFVFIKATEGKSRVDDQFRRNWYNAELQKIPKGAYHFFVPGRDPVLQANNYIQMVPLKSGDLPPVLDVEKAGRLSVAQMQKDVLQWLILIEKKYGVKPILYTNINFYLKYFSTSFSDYPLWIAHYLQPDKPRINYKWVFWQHSETGSVDGIQSHVDFNVFSGDSTDFKKILIP